MTVRPKGEIMKNGKDGKPEVGLKQLDVSCRDSGLYNGFLGCALKLYVRPNYS